MREGLARMEGRLRRPLPLLDYLFLSTETHAHCAALAFFSLIAFFPASTLLLTLARNALPGAAGQAVLLETLREYYPQGQDFLVRNLEVSVAQHGRELGLSGALWILIGAAGIFGPLETAFNRVWGFAAHRPYWRNQLVGFLLTAAGCALALGFLLLTPALSALAGRVVRDPVLAHALGYVALRLGALAVAVVAIYLLYRFLPNGPVRSRQVLPAALLAGLSAELVRWGFLAALPLLHLQRSQGPYYVSVSFILQAYVLAFVVVAGAFLAAVPELAAAAPES